MLVRQILKLKSGDDTHTIDPGATLAEVAEVLATRRIGVLMVSRDGKGLAGIISERDIVREIGQKGAAALSETVEAAMTRDVVTCTCADRADDLLQTMTEGRFRHLPVVEDGRILAMISQGDVVKAKLAELHMEKDALQSMIMGH